jgi:hypothetical protein
MSNVRDLVEKVTSLPGLKSPINLPCWSRSRFSLAVRPSSKPDSAKRLTDGSDRFDFLEISGNPTALGLSGDVDVYLCGPPGMVESGRQHVAKLGLLPANIHFEKFAPASEALAV